MFSKRQKEILLSLAKNKGLVTAEWIAKELGVSDRTVRNEIKLIQSECHSLGVSIESVRGKGYKFQVDDPQLFENVFNQLTKEVNDELSINFSEQDNRVTYLLRRLLLEKESIKLESFEDEIFVSKSTIQNDLKVVREILKKNKLSLVNRPHYGTHVEGDEYMKRLCLSNHILSRNSNLSIDSETFQLLDQELFEKITEIIIKKVVQ